ncbi:MAG: protoheme IX farnesyltransferase [Hyphomicrobiales bacterium]|nr:protoheme IX farnesyltransferase [Hyphomicrobiales bacterium]
MGTAGKTADGETRREPRGGVVDHLVLLKPRVMSLVVFTGAVGFALAPVPFDGMKLAETLTAIAAGAGACGALNMWWEADIDANMARTAMRPIPRGAVRPRQALTIGVLLSAVSIAALAIEINRLAAALLALTIAIYVPLYTMVLKRRTPLNIVIGGAAGALPPAIGWAAATDGLGFGPVALFLLIFLWTPPHFWALALCRSGDYARVGVPMLPNVAGPARTCRQIVAYALLLVPTSLSPLAIPGVGWLYGSVAAASNVVLLWRALALYRLREGEESPRRKAAMALFGYSILYMFLLFAALLAEALIRR